MTTRTRAIAAACAAATFSPALHAALVGVSLTNGLYEISTTDGALTAINADTGITFGGLEYDAADNRLLGLTYGSQAGLYAIDPHTGVATSIGSAGRFVFEGALQFSPSGTLYAASAGTSATPRLLTINPATGASTVVATLGGSTGHDINGLAWRSDGKLVGLDGILNAVVVIDPATGAVSTLTDLTATLGAFGGMTNAGGDTAFYSLDNGDLYTLDLFTGSASYVATMPQPMVGLAFIPGPAPATLAAIAAAGLASRRRRH